MKRINQSNRGNIANTSFFPYKYAGPDSVDFVSFPSIFFLIEEFVINAERKHSTDPRFTDPYRTRKHSIGFHTYDSFKSIKAISIAYIAV